MVLGRTGGEVSEHCVSALNWLYTVDGYMCGWVYVCGVCVCGLLFVWVFVSCVFVRAGVWLGVWLPVMFFFFFGGGEGQGRWC